MENFNYNEKILPLVKLLCENDEGKDESNFGQMKEIVKDLAIVFGNNNFLKENFLEYIESLKEEK